MLIYKMAMEDFGNGNLRNLENNLVYFNYA